MALKGLGRVLVLNAGSSSLKFKLFDLAPALASTVGGEQKRCYVLKLHQWSHLNIYYFNQSSD